MTKHLFPALLLLAVCFPAFAAEKNDVAGNWDLNIGDPPGAAAWLGIQRQGDAYTGQFQPPAGAVGPAEEFKVDGNKITFKAHGQQFEATVADDRITGTVTRGEAKAKLTGQRLVAPVEVSGSWDLKLEGGETPLLTVIQSGPTISGALTVVPGVLGTATAKLDGNNITFTAKLPEGAERTLEGEVTAKGTVKGDAMAGEITAKGKTHKFTAQRRREWAETIALFNGKDLDGWKPIGKPENSHWKVVEGVMTNAAAGANLVSDQKFNDFRIHVEFRVPEHGNGGVYLRGRYEIQVADSFEKPLSPGMCGAIYGRIVPSKNACKKPGEWQTFDATLIGNHVTVVHNDELIIDNQPIDGITGGALDSNEGAPGPIYLQGDHSAIEFRKVEVTPAKPTVFGLTRIQTEPTTKPK